MNANDVQTKTHCDGAVDPDLGVEIAADLLSGEPLPRLLGDYELLSELGRGGMGVVYLARQRHIDRLVAVKMIRDGCLTDVAGVQRLYNEARAAGRMSHPHLVSVHEVGEHDGQHFFSMDYIEGMSLAELVAAGPVEPRRAAAIVKTVAEAIHYAHEHGVLHRDLKPANVLLDKEERPYVTDFGLAKNVDSDSGLTKAGTTLGTPSFMPPEQASGRHDLVDRTSDVYSLGAILYSLLTGQPPFRGASVIDTMMDVVHKDLLPPRTILPTVDRRLETICLKCLNKDRHQRYATAADLADDLNRYLEGDPIHAKPTSRASHSWHWLRRVPLVAALSGGRAVEPTAWQRRVNRAMIVVPLFAMVSLVGWRALPQRLPAEIRIASAAQGGAYHEMADAMADAMVGTMPRPIRVLETRGSMDNVWHLMNRTAEVAFLQENMLGSEAIAVVAPLAHEAILILARRDRDIHSLDDLAGRRISLGVEGSGSRANSIMLLAAVPGWRAGDVQAADLPFSALATDPTLDGAIVTMNRQSPDLEAFMLSGKFQLLPLDDVVTEEITMSYPSFQLSTIWAGSFAASTADQPAIPEENVRTVATIMFLAVRRDAPDVLVTTLLETLYSDPEMPERLGIISARKAAQASEFDLHPAARRFFQAWRGAP